ncbi:S1-like domain-containing protein [Meloidogyne graminicola]|uniref:Probable RNA-binding protein EIF1AD n=1 Tax=Meloidogyne graminicola TaxID=189291 RepID=A0A8S9ZCS3_9BILA|nr:S1-like domain-containing protein [Meloidogyne graminicola]
MPKTTQKKFVTNQLIHTLVEELAKGQFVAKILASRGNNLHQVETSNGEIFLISMPTRFRRTLWVRRGNFVIAQPIEEGDKVKAEIVHVLDNENICYLIEKGEWPERFLKEIKSLKGVKRIDENGKELKDEEKDLMFPSMSSSSDDDDEEEEEEEADEADNEDNDDLEEANNDEKK